MNAAGSDRLLAATSSRTTSWGPWTRRALATVALVALLGLPAEGAEDRAGNDRTPSAADGPEVATDAYLDQVLDLTFAKAYYADRLDGERWLTIADDQVAEADDTSDVYGFVDELLSALGDNHSKLLRPWDVRALSTKDETLRGRAPSGGVDGASIGTIDFPPPAATAQSPAGREYIQPAHTVLSSPACGWVVDVRGNTGGSAITLLAAAVPLLGPGPALSYRYRDGDTEAFEITDDGDLISSDGTVLASTEGRGSFQPSSGPVAVLQDSLTSSAAEALVMALRGRPMTRSFGEPTRGKPTGVELFPLSDGSALALTTAIGVDYAGQKHEGSIAPDQGVTGTDAAEAAAAWITEQPSCQGG